MRGILWRGIALALAGVISWLLWNWPEPQESEALELTLETECPSLQLQDDESLACWKDGRKIIYSGRIQP